MGNVLFTIDDNRQKNEIPTENFTNSRVFNTFIQFRCHSSLACTYSGFPA